MDRKPKGAAKSPKKGASVRQVDKDKGHPRNHRKRSAKESKKQESVQSRKSRPRREGTKGNKATDVTSPQIVVTVGHGHPRVEPETYDAAALLKSVLAAVEPKIHERLASLAETAVPNTSDPETDTETARAVQAVGRQITEAVRAGIVEGMRVRERHLAQLAVIDRAAAQANSLSSLQARISAEMEHAGLRRVSDLADLSPFNLAVAPGSSPASADSPEDYELVTPAYVEADSGRVVERGWIKVAEASLLPAGKAHGRMSREHGSKQHRKDSGTTAGIEEAKGISQRSGAAAHAGEEQGRPVQHRTTGSGGASPLGDGIAEEEPSPTGEPSARKESEVIPVHPSTKSGSTNPTAPGSVPVARILPQRLSTAETDDQPPGRRP
ncbi:MULTISPECIES: hypothetical protein [Actinomadura]|uniref:Uncharacterized protein n=1 Tax=Actinomadura geliboluensis TaxID=882440 RepID=A0A5S4GWP4_9ACTN|nr:hypothetical protein [Actinomadura geliboluensis]TMR37403.1 hypothetical protein ETD96_18605 [Actinomadura geliboluensis]